MIDTSFWKAGEIQLSFLANIDKASCDEAKAVFLCLMQKKKPRIRLNLRLVERGADCTLEWNSGGHFKDADLRTAKAFRWVMAEHA